MKDLGLVWSDQDRVAVTAVDVVSDVSDDDDDVTSIEVFVAKSFFGIRIRLEIGPDGIAVAGKDTKNFGGSKINSVSRLDSSKFVVSFSEGPPKVFDSAVKGFEVTSFDLPGGSNLDFRNRSCHGLAFSENGSICALLQNGGLDDSRSRCKVSSFSLVPRL